MRLAHLSDVHVLDLEGVHWTRFVNKRLTGLVNLVGSRRDAHPQALLEAAVAELQTDASIDHVVITGDLTNLALESELARARRILEPLAGRISVIPGNHDVYTRGAERSRRFESWFGDWMWASGKPQTYPWVKHVDRPDHPGLTLIGFCSAVARLPFFATGVVSQPQLDRTRALGPTLAPRIPVALVHHNLHARGFRKDRMHGLSNRDAFLDTLAESGVRLCLHGHTHVAQRSAIRNVEVIGSGSSTWSANHPDHIGRYNVYSFSTDGLEAVEVRRWHATSSAFRTA
jgi:3',5'-cyclic AMP phosphodiesterase CpdA